jgi:N-acetylglutamate synthase-like GNAT family acetyltransferase
MSRSLISIAPGDTRWAGFVGALRSVGLPTEDLTTAAQHFYAMVADDQAIAYGGFALYGSDALLRSVVVPQDCRRRGGGRNLVSALLDLIRQRGTERAWLLTMSAAAFFEHVGFERQAREAAPTTIASSAEFSSLCPTSAVLMCRTLD